jgi:cysteinyl-tRNA synthetase
VDGTSSIFSRKFNPEVIRFFMMQAHYRSTLEITEDALIAGEKGYARLADASKLMENLHVGKESSFSVETLIESFYSAMNDDFNAPILVANLFEAAKKINLINDKKETISSADLELLKKEFLSFVEDVLGIPILETSSDGKLAPVMDLVLQLRQKARENKDWTTSDQIRDGLAAAGIVVKDGKEGTTWN